MDAKAMKKELKSTKSKINLDQVIAFVKSQGGSAWVQRKHVTQVLLDELDSLGYSVSVDGDHITVSCLE